MSFVRAPNPIWYMVDLDGQGLNDEYYAFFLTNTLPYIPQNVYRDPEGLTVWTGNVVEFYPNGTLPNNLYFDPNLVYRIEIRHGNSQTDPLIYEINNFVPGSGGGGELTDLSLLTSENQVTNPNFSQVFFVGTPSSSQPTLTITTAGTYDVAPGWQLVLTGTGTTTLTQLIFSGLTSNSSPNAINYALRVNNNGWTSAILQQRFNNNGGIFTGGAISMSVTARAQGSSEIISLVYSPSDAGDPAILVPNANDSGLLTTGDYRVVQGTDNLPVSVNTDLSTVAYVDMQIVLPPSGIVDVTDFQVVGQSNPIPVGIDPLTVNPPYQQQSEERHIDHSFHVYAQQLIQNTKKNILVGWTFALNPFQFITKTLTTVTNQTQYIADQTILHQETASSLQSGQAAQTGNFGLELKAINGVNANRFAIIQYIDPASFAPYWGQILSSLVRARIFTTHDTQVPLKMRLIYRTTLPSTISNTEPITGWDVNGDVTFAAGWTALEPVNDLAYVLENAYANNEGATTFPALSFDQFSVPGFSGSLPTTQTLGVVLYTTEPLNNTAASEDSIVIDRVSLIPNKFAAEACAESFDESLRRCQYYYEKTYDTGVLPGTVTDVGRIYARTTLAPNFADQFHPFSFAQNYQATKRAIPIMSFYSPTTGTLDAVNLSVLRNGAAAAVSSGTNPSDYVVSTHFVLNASLSKFDLRCTDTTNNFMTTSAANAGDEGTMYGHYVADARLGL